MADQRPIPELAQSLDPAAEKRRELEALLPEAFSEGRLNLQALKRALGEDSNVEGGERYRLDWAGKSDAYKVLQTPTTATLRPQRDKSVNFDAAQHVFIEGENLEVLKVLQRAYFGKVKLIYIDPPYNTGSDSFIYPDRFQESKEDYLKRVNELTDDGTLMREGFFRKNTKDSGHYHSNWLSMMLPRLYIARNLLREDGVILVSIDDNEVANLKLLMDEVFGSENFVAQLVWEKGRKNDARLFSVGHEYILLYARSLSNLKDKKTTWREPKPGAKEIIEKWRELTKIHGKKYDDIERALRDWYASLPETHPSKKLSRYRNVDKWGVWRDENISWPGGGGPRYSVLHPITKKPCAIPERGWVFAKPETMKRMIDVGVVTFREDHTQPPIRKSHLIPIPEEYLADEDISSFDEEGLVDDEHVATQVMGSVIYKQSQVAVKYLRKLMGAKVFDNPKDHVVLARLIFYCMAGDNSGLVVDFFGGSASTVEAVLQLNREDGGSRRSICVQIAETVDAETAAYKEGYRTIADVSRSRIRRVLERMEDAADLVSPVARSAGLKCYELAPSNMKQWRGDGLETPEALAEQMKMFVKSDKDGADTEALLYELLLKLGQELTTPVDSAKVGKGRVFSINGHKMLFVLEGFDEAMIEPLLALKPEQIVVLDSVFHDSDELKTNFELQCRDAGVKFTCL